MSEVMRKFKYFTTQAFTSASAKSDPRGKKIIDIDPAYARLSLFCFISRYSYVTPASVILFINEIVEVNEVETIPSR